MTTTMPGRERFVRAAARAVALGLAAATLAACHTTTYASRRDVILSDHRQRHPILISEEPEVFQIPVGMSASGISPEIAEALHDFLRDYAATGTGQLTIQVPMGAANDVAAGTVGAALRRAILSAGVPPGSVRTVPYAALGHDYPAAVRVSFLKMKTAAPACGIWDNEVRMAGKNQPTFNLGCANQANFAAMVENPADIVRPRPLDPANGQRRAKVIADYATGRETRSQMQLNEIDAGQLGSGE